MITPIEESFSVAVLGQWNPGIFRPAWVQANLASEPGAKIEVAFAINEPSLPPRISVDDFLIFPSITRLDIKSKLSIEAQSKAVEMMKKVLGLLEHTPISAVGVNQGYIVPVEDAGLAARVFDMSDNGQIDSGEYYLEHAGVSRRFGLQSGGKLNLLLESEGDHIKLNFNFHFDVENAQEARDVLVGSLVGNISEKVKAILLDVYSLQLDEG